MVFYLIREQMFMNSALILCISMEFHNFACLSGFATIIYVNSIFKKIKLYIIRIHL